MNTKENMKEKMKFMKKIEMKSRKKTRRVQTCIGEGKDKKKNMEDKTNKIEMKG